MKMYLGLILTNFPFTTRRMTIGCCSSTEKVSALCVGTEVVCKAYGGIVFINLEIRNNPSAIKDTVAHVPVSASQKRKTGYFYIGGIKVQVNSHLGVAVIKKPGKNRMLLCICVKDHEKRE